MMVTSNVEDRTLFRDTGNFKDAVVYLQTPSYCCRDAVCLFSNYGAGFCLGCRGLFGGIGFFLRVLVFIHPT